MISDIFHLTRLILTFLPSYTLTTLRQRISAHLHKRTYNPLPAAQLKNVVVIGGSFGGHQVVKRLTEMLPTGYRVVLLEKNSHLNYVFAFPRFSVVKGAGYEPYAFIPYSGLARRACEGVFSHVRDRAVRVEGRFVELESGERVEYAYLVVATGTSSGLPSKTLSTESEGAQKELQRMQDQIAQAERIAVVGGGAVGVELASDIKDFYPGKQVLLVHSRGQLLPSFGKRLHAYVMQRLADIDVTVRLDERPDVPAKGNVLRLSTGEEKEFDLIIPCTGQRPNSSILSTLTPTSISKETQHIQVKPTLQVSDIAFPHIFALGDVAATGGPKMGRAAYFQAEVVAQNVLASILGKPCSETYKPNFGLEGSIKLTLGKTHLVLYTKEENGCEILVPLNIGKEDMDVKRQWSFFGADVKAFEITMAKLEPEC